MSNNTKPTSNTKTNDEITASFRTAANAVTKLYKSVSCQEAKIRDEGYLQALDDMLMACDSGINVWEWAVKRRLALINKYSSDRTASRASSSPGEVEAARSDAGMTTSQDEAAQQTPPVCDFTFKSSFEESSPNHNEAPKESSAPPQSRIFSTSPQRLNSTGSTNHLRLAPFRRRRDGNVVDEIIEDIKYLSNDSSNDNSTAADERHPGKRRTAYNEYLEKGIDKLHQNNIYKRSRS